VAATSGVLGPVGGPGTGGSDQRMLALLASCHKASQLNWLVTDSLGFLVRSTQNCAASDSRFEMHCETAAAATCGHMKQPTRNVYVGCFMWRTMWRLVALCFASRPIESRYIWRSVTRSATENGPEGLCTHRSWNKQSSMHQRRAYDTSSSRPDQRRKKQP